MNISDRATGLNSWYWVETLSKTDGGKETDDVSGAGEWYWAKRITLKVWQDSIATYAIQFTA
jgi:hypothetical protein